MLFDIINKVNNNDAKQTFHKNMLWSFVEKWSTQIASSIVSVFLMRILSADDYGVVAISSLFIGFFQSFVDLGLTSSLIQKKDPDEIDYSTVFYSNFAIAFLFYIFIYVFAPLVGSYYGNRTLVSLIRVAGITILISPIKSITYAYASKNSLFKYFFYSSFIGTIVGAFVGIYLAIEGYGYWALIANAIVDCVIDNVILLITLKIKIRKSFSFNRLKEMLNFSWKLSFSSFLNIVYERLNQLIIGKVYSTADLAYYDKGQSIVSKITANIDGAYNDVLFPSLSNNQTDLSKVKETAAKSLKVISYILIPSLLGIIAISKSLVLVVYTDKWIQIIPYIRVFCIIGLFRPIHSVNLNIIKSLGRSDIFLKQEIIKKILSLLIIVFCVTRGPMIMAYGVMVNSFLCQFINSIPNKKLIKYDLFEQYTDIMPNILIGLLMFVVVKSIELFVFNRFFLLIIQVLIGVVIYVFLSIMFKNESFSFLIEIIKNRRKNNE